MSNINPGAVGSTNSSGAISVSISGNGVLGSGSQTVSTAGTRVQLSSISIACKKVAIQANAGNTGRIYIGDATVASSDGIFIYPTQIFELTPSNLNLVYLDTETNGNSVVYLYEN